METSDLNLILDQHKLWASSNGEQGSRANLRDADLYGANLKNANLWGAKLWGANLNCANLISANLYGANLRGANLRGADLSGADLSGADLKDADLKDAILPDVFWVIPGCLVQLNNILYGFYLKKDNKLINFVQDSFGFFIQNNVAEETFDMLVEDQIIRGIPYWVKYSGLKQIASELV